MLWVLIALSAVELVVVHLLVSHWSRRVALVLSIASLGGVVWLVAMIRSFRHLPVRIAEGQLIWRVGRIACLTVPIETIAGLRPSWDAAAIKDRSVQNCALVAYPNIVIDLRVPVKGRRGRRVTALPHRLDDPAAFTAALARLSAPG